MAKSNIGLDSNTKILNAARKIFSSVGFDGARIDEIAKLAGVNKAMIYYHFKSKELLYSAVINSLFQKEEYYKEILHNPNLNSEKKLETAITHLSEIVEMNKLERCSIIAREMVSKSDIFYTIRDKYWIPDFKFIRAIIEEGISKNEFKTEKPPEFIVFTIFSHIIYYKINEVTYEGSEIFGVLYPKNNREKMLNYLMDLLKLILGIK